MTTKFIAGNCVGFPLGGYLPPEKRDKYFSSMHILSQKDIDRGWYYGGDNVGIYRPKHLYYLSQVVNRTPTFHFIKRCQTLRGKSLQPVPHFKMVDIFEECGDYNIVSTYVVFKGVKTRVEGVYYKGMFYFDGMNAVGYKAKVYVDEEGYLRGWNTSSLSGKQKKQCYNVLTSDKVYKASEVVVTWGSINLSEGFAEDSYLKVKIDLEEGYPVEGFGEFIFGKEK